MPGSLQWSLSLRFPHQNPRHAYPLPIRATYPANPILDFITHTILGEEADYKRYKIFNLFNLPAWMWYAAMHYKQTTKAGIKLENLKK
jgi:hypothetical protein